jgi:Protein of unknown function (DUF4245)
MVRSLALVIGVILVILLIMPPRNPEAVREVDYAPELAAARQSAPFEVLAPEGLSEAWRSTSVRWRPGEDGTATWHVGFVTPQDEYAAIGQSNRDVDEYVRLQSNRGFADGAVTIDGIGYQRLYREDKDQRSLVRLEGGPDGPVLVITGTASWEELTVLARSLR